MNVNCQEIVIKNTKVNDLCVISKFVTTNFGIFDLLILKRFMQTQDVRVLSRV